MPEVRIVESLAQVDRQAWSALFPGEIEDFDYLCAVEGAGLAGFRWRYILVSEAGRLRAAAPAFVTDYRLDTTLPRAGRQAVEALRRVTPGLLSMRLACLGSPCTERACAGVAADASPDERRALGGALFLGLEQIAQDASCRLTGVKDVAPGADEPLAEAAAAAGYAPIPSLPSATLTIGFSSVEAYLASLSAGTRRDMRRKLRARPRVRIEFRPDVDDCLDRIMALYRQTLARAEMAFEELTPAYFSGIARRMGGRAFYGLYFEGGELIAFNLLLTDGRRLLDKYFCMDGERARALNLYFLSWFENVQLCLDRGLSAYEAGQAAHEVKLRLGCGLAPSVNLFRHRNPVVNGALKLASPLFAADPQPRRVAA